MPRCAQARARGMLTPPGRTYAPANLREAGARCQSPKWAELPSGRRSLTHATMPVRIARACRSPASRAAPPEPAPPVGRATREAVAQASQVAEAREAARTIQPGRQPRGRGGERDPFTGELRKREVLPLLVLHFISDGRATATS